MSEAAAGPVSVEMRGSVALIQMDDGKANALSPSVFEAIHALSHLLLACLLRRFGLLKALGQANLVLYHLSKVMFKRTLEGIFHRRFLFYLVIFVFELVA